MVFWGFKIQNSVRITKGSDNRDSDNRGSTVIMNICNTFTPQIKRNFYGLNVMYHNHSSPGVLQLSWCATASQWNVVQLPIVMHIIMLQHPQKANALKLNYHSLYRHTVSTGFEFISDKIVFRVKLACLMTLI